MGELEVVSNLCRSPERKVSMKNHTCEMRIGQLGAASMLCRMMNSLEKEADWHCAEVPVTESAFMSVEVAWSQCSPTNSFDCRQQQDFLGTGWWVVSRSDPWLSFTNPFKHQIHYKDNEREGVILAKERMKLKVTTWRTVRDQVIYRGATIKANNDEARSWQVCGISCGCGWSWRPIRLWRFFLGKGERLSNVACISNGQRAFKIVSDLTCNTHCHVSSSSVFWKLWLC